MPEKIEFSTTTVLQRNVWGERVLAINIPKEQEGNFGSLGGDIVKVAIELVREGD